MNCPSASLFYRHNSWRNRPEELEQPQKPLSRGFMDDLMVTTSAYIQANWISAPLEKATTWTRMIFRSQKSRLSIIWSEKVKTVPAHGARGTNTINSGTRTLALGGGMVARMETFRKVWKHGWRLMPPGMLDLPTWITAMIHLATYIVGQGQVLWNVP